MKISVVGCTYAMERFEDFAECVESLLDQTYDDVEIVIVVDGNQDVFDRAADRFGESENVSIHCNDQNMGLLKSRNAGAELATGEVVAFIDDDAVADERWVEELVESYQQEEDVLAAGGKMTPEWIGDRPDFLPEEFYWLVGVTHRGFPETAKEVRNTFGSNISFRRDVFRDLDGFDPNIGGRKGDANLQGGETELCERLRLEYDQGVWYNPDAVVAHKVFKYRTRFRWLIDRAFWQGYSKRAMESILDDAGETEEEFLRRLVTDFLPSRVSSLVRSPSVSKFEQLLGLVVFTGAVGAGYSYGILKW